MDQNQLKNIIFRPATVEDAAEVAELYLSSRKEHVAIAPLAHTDASVRGWIKNILIPSGEVEIALVSGEIVGMCGTSQADEISWIDHLYLRPDSVGNGIGALMLERALSKLDRPVRLYTFQANTGARRFYERFGFVALEFGDGSGNEEKTPDVLYELT